MNKPNRQKFNSLDYYADHENDPVTFNDPYSILISKRIQDKRSKKNVKSRVKVS